ncbi:hypothetical protein [Pseudoxanthomonas koreensis]|uniref:hypothetical protein n=1 Tax=Pseudoxanthomonas koreensis TaxID=266061 RepID=UPI0035A6720D
MSRRRIYLLLTTAMALCLAAAIGLPELFPGLLSRTQEVVLVIGGLALGVVALLCWEPPAGESSPPAIRRRYVRELAATMTAYAVLLVLSFTLLKQVEGTALRAVLALLPVAPIALAVAAMVRYFRGVDELQQRIELEAVSLGSALLALLYLSGGLLQAADVIELPADAVMIWVFPLMCLSYGLAKFRIALRYR